MRFLRLSYQEVQDLPEGYDDVAVEISRRERAERESQARKGRRGR